MQFLSLLTGIIPVASAQALKGAGKGGAGISDMWDQICETIPCSISGGLVGFFTSRIVAFIWPLIGGVAVCLVIYAGIRIIFSQGKEDGISEAKKIITYAVAGVILAILASTIFGFFGAMFAGWLQ